MGPLPADDDSEGHDTGGTVFQAALRLGALAFAVVLAIGVRAGTDPAGALLRALGALLAVATCGWIGDRLMTVLAERVPRDGKGDQA